MNLSRDGAQPASPQHQRSLASQRRVMQLLRTPPPKELGVPHAVIAVERLQLAVPLCRALAGLGYLSEVQAGGDHYFDISELAEDDLIVLDCWHRSFRPDVLAQRFAARPEMLGRCVIVESPELGLDTHRELLALGVLAVLPRSRFDERLAALLERVDR